MSTTEATSGNSALDAISNSYNDTTSKKKDGSTIDQEGFLTLLVAQMQNQDPLNPMDSAQYTEQLTQFSSLEQQISTNSFLADISAKLDKSAERDPMTYMGKEVTTTTSALSVSDGEAQKVSYSIDDPAYVGMVIFDSAGEEVSRINLGAKEAGDHDVTWDGKDADGNPIRDGVYTYEIIATDVSGKAVKVDTEASGIVDGVTFKDGKTYLTIKDRLVDPDDILSIRIPEAAS